MTFVNEYIPDINKHHIGFSDTDHPMLRKPILMSI